VRSKRGTNASAGGVADGQWQGHNSPQYPSPQGYVRPLNVTGCGLIWLVQRIEAFVEANANRYRGSLPSNEGCSAGGNGSLSEA
jgi:hypothetical protein